MQALVVSIGTTSKAGGVISCLERVWVTEPLKPQVGSVAVMVQLPASVSPPQEEIMEDVLVL
jgi:hypothetical protein